MCRGLCQGRDMAQEVSVIVSDDDRVRLEAIVKERNHSHKHVQRAQIVLLSADRLAVAEVAKRVGVGGGGVALAAGLCRGRRRQPLRDAKRKPGKPRLDDAIEPRVVAPTLTEPPGERPIDRPGYGEMAATALRSASGSARPRSPAASAPLLQAVDRSGLRRQARDVVGLYVDPPRTAWSSRSTRSRRSRRSTAPSPGCR